MKEFGKAPIDVYVHPCLPTWILGEKLKYELGI